MLLYNLLIKTDLKKLVYVYDSHIRAPIFYGFLDNWLYTHILETKKYKVELWKCVRNGDELVVYVVPVKEK